jgi:hypothetical protein
VHDRRIEGETYVFGNAGGLYKSAMTWWDHKTRSIWSQPIGRALAGALKDTELTLLPAQVTTWGNWKSTYPETLVMTNDLERISFRRQGFSKDFVIGLHLEDQDKAYYFTDVESAGVINDRMDDFDVLVWAAEGDYRTYLRQVGDIVLSFRYDDGVLKDIETGSTWDVKRGLATDGPRKGDGLQPVPSLTSFDWAWWDFYPGSEIYQP